MPRKFIYIFLIILGSSLLLASITFFLDTLTSTEPAGFGQQIRDWLTFFVSLLTLYGAHVVKKNDKPKAPTTNVYGNNPQIASGSHARNIHVNGTFIENAANVEN